MRGQGMSKGGDGASVAITFKGWVHRRDSGISGGGISSTTWPARVIRSGR